MAWWMLVAIVALVIASDRALLAAERRGWVYWRRSPGRRASAGHALQSIEVIFRPSVQHEVVQRAAIEVDDDDDGEPPHR